MGFEVWRRKIWTHWNHLRCEHQAGEQAWSTDFQCSSGPHPECFIQTPRVCIRAVPKVHTLNTAGAGTLCLLQGPCCNASCNPRAWIMSGEKSGWREGRKEAFWAPAPCPCMRLGDSQRVYQPQELGSSEVIFYIVSSNIFASRYIKWIRKLEQVGDRASH